MKKTLLTLTVALTLNACQQIQNPVADGNLNPNNSNQIVSPQNLDFSRIQGVEKSLEINGQTIAYIAYENIVYVTNPVDTRYQTLNIYIPKAYFNQQSIDGFTADTAPIFFPNNVGGYMPAKAGTVGLGRDGKPNAISVALSKGYVVASAGARGRSETTGKAPAAIIDLKAAVRYLRANDKIMAGDAKKIISNGTSAGGALSALLGSSGDAADYLPELHRLGAANSSDRIFAVSAYCPITNLEHADAAYEWQFNGVNDYQKISIQSLDYRVERKLIKGTQTAEQIALSNKLKPLFPAYVNSLKLKNSQGMPMTLTADGNGSFKKQIEQMLVQSAQTALNAGTDLGNPNWLKVENGKVISADFDAYARAVGRQKTAPAFDGVDLSTGENNLFGDEKHANKHFTEFGTQNSTVANAETADKHIVKQMNAMNYISSNSGAQHYRIRHGANDRDTSLAIPTLLALQLRQAGKNVDFALPWGVSHSGDYDLEELFAWAKKVSTSQP